MYIFRKLLLIYFISLPWVTSAAAENNHCAASQKLDKECGSYCYKIVKHLLQYAASVQSKEKQFDELMSKNQILESTVKSLEDQLQLSKSHQQYCLTKEEVLDKVENAIITRNDNTERLTIELKKRDSDFKSKNIAHLQKIKELEDKVRKMSDEIVSKNNQVNRLNTELTNKDSEIEKIKTQSIKNADNIKKLENNIQNEQAIPSICIGKLTGIYQIKVPGSSPFEVLCDSSLAGSGWTVIQRRQDGSESFNRIMNDFRAGFGKLSGEFFLGLDKIHLLTKSKQHELYIYLKDFDDKVRYAQYSNFSIGGEEEIFELKTLGTYSGNGGDSLRGNLNMQFTTPDQNHGDWITGYCAQTYSSGWWFDNCGNSFLNGIYIPKDAVKFGQGIFWNTWKDDSLKFVQMMIRPKEQHL